MSAATRHAIVALLWTIVVFTLLAAIWLVSWQWAATGGLLLLVAVTFSGLALKANEDARNQRQRGAGRKLPPQTATITTERGDNR